MNLDDIMHAKEELDNEFEEIYKLIACMYGMKIIMDPFIPKDSCMIVCGENTYNRIKKCNDEQTTLNQINDKDL